MKTFFSFLRIVKIWQMSPVTVNLLITCMLSTCTVITYIVITCMFITCMPMTLVMHVQLREILLVIDKLQCCIIDIYRHAVICPCIPSCDEWFDGIFTAIFEYYFQFRLWPNFRHWRVILHQRAKFRQNRTIQPPSAEL